MTFMIRNPFIYAYKQPKHVSVDASGRGDNCRQEGVMREKERTLVCMARYFI